MVHRPLCELVDARNFTIRAGSSAALGHFGPESTLPANWASFPSFWGQSHCVGFRFEKVSYPRVFLTAISFSVRIFENAYPNSSQRRFWPTRTSTTNLVAPVALQVPGPAVPTARLCQVFPDENKSGNFVGTSDMRHGLLGCPRATADIGYATAWTANGLRTSWRNALCSQGCRTRRCESKPSILARSGRHRWQREAPDRSIRRHHRPTA